MIFNNNSAQNVVIQKNQGTAFWMPQGNGEYIEVKVSSWNLADTQHTIFMHELPPGNRVMPHLHQDNTEIFIGLAGQGIMTLDGNDYDFLPETVIYVTKKTVHAILAIGNIPLRFMVIISPTGLEGRFKQMGQLKIPGDPAPSAFKSGALSESHGVTSLSMGGTNV